MSAPPLHHRVTSPDQLSAHERGLMLRLMQRCYEGVTTARFAADLAEKDHVVLLVDDQQIIRGFSTQQVFTLQGSDGPLRVLFSGDTIIEPECWGSHELARGWCTVAAAAMTLMSSLPLYWLLISKGYRTYLYLPLFFKTYFPAQTSSHAENLRKLRDEIAQHKFGRCFDPGSGIVRFPQHGGQLTADLAGVPTGRRGDPEVEFFLEANPGFAQGDELVCFAEISLQNTKGIGHRWLKRALEARA
jgi:hypothetical protein